MATVTIGILNNMPDTAMRATERQYNDLLHRALPASDNLQLRWFSIQPRDGYEPVAALTDGPRLNGLIVTGIEPRTRSLRDEAFWAEMVRIIEWAADNTTATMFSCLAAHAAVLHLDNVLRYPLTRKLSGLFKSVVHPSAILSDALPPSWRFPHSRNNNLPAPILRQRGYRLLATAPQAGPDLFEKRCRNSQFWFLQSHPEYDGRALMREYRRDVLRYLTGERNRYPEMPLHYFDERTEQALQLLRVWAERERHPSVMVDMQLIIGRANLSEPWRADAAQLYRHWLSGLAQGDVAYLPEAAELQEGTV